MRLEYAITIADPKSVNLLFTSASKKSQLTKSDIMVSLGILQSRCPFGLNLILAKYTKDKTANKRALNILKDKCAEIIPYNIKKKSYKNLSLVIHKLCNIAINDYCRTADTNILPCRCRGRGTVNSNVCTRCHGSGIRRISSVQIYNLMSNVIDIKKTSWVRYWKPFYDEIIALCDITESETEKEFKKITG